MSDFVHTNRLASETSPYLLQHAHNPVDWLPWSEDAWQKARDEDKLVLVSIGYSSCHWCHVMERESFENRATAELMNSHFICIKVDREERPDVDQVYMSAVQLMTGGGGWPLNCFCLPDGRPVYGGTYFPNAAWNTILERLHALYHDDRERLLRYAGELTGALRGEDAVLSAPSGEPDWKDIARRTVAAWKKSFDNREGGPNRVPKFPLPNNYDFLLRYAVLSGDDDVLQHVLLTLDKMAAGGLFDQLGGGFARYSTDGRWKVPHFEKMLYDNAQLVSLYAAAYRLTKKERYAEVLEATMAFVFREMTSPEGCFYSALDADSEGEEGRFYVWQDLTAVLGSRSGILAEMEGDLLLQILHFHFSVDADGLWEHGRHILLGKHSVAETAAKFSIGEDRLREILQAAREKLLEERHRRPRPGLDHKQLTAWNALMISACCDAYDALGRKEYLDAAVRCADRFLSHARSAGGGLLRQPGMRSAGNKAGSPAESPAFLDDYALFSDALLALYRCTFREQWLDEARSLVQVAKKHFFDEASGFFWYTSVLDTPLIVRTKEISDNVIPASNSVMARVLFYLGRYTEDASMEAGSLRMLASVGDALPAYGSGYSNWGILLLHQAFPFHEVVMAGPAAGEKRGEFVRRFLPNVLLAGSADGSARLPLLENRFSGNRTLIYVCENRSCRLPVESAEKALQLLQD
jgi:uncharacterized protein YyaL (SSP411 family)